MVKASIEPVEMEEVSTTDPIEIPREKGSCRASKNLLIREDLYETVRTLTVIPLHQIKTAEIEMNIRRMVRLTNTPGEDDGHRMNPY